MYISLGVVENIAASFHQYGKIFSLTGGRLVSRKVVCNVIEGEVKTSDSGFDQSACSQAANNESACSDCMALN